MNTLKLVLFYFIFLSLWSCDRASNSTTTTNSPVECINNQIDSKLIYKGERTFLYGGDNDTMHFDITGWNFNKCNLKLGLGRETFPALIRPSYIEEKAVDFLKDQDSCIVLKSGLDYLVYPHVIMAYHEAVNEYIGQEPVLVAYCKLANLGAVYKRNICDVELDFGIAGYTYSEQLVYSGVRSFVMWDKQTESLWWPLNNIAVSGFFKNSFLEKFDEFEWYNTTWVEVKENLDNVKVLISQDPTWEVVDYRISTDTIDCY